MPRFPQFSERIQSLPNSVFERYQDTFRRLGRKLFPFHIGDTYLKPPYDLPVDPDFLELTPHFHQYGNTFGVAALLRVLAEKVKEDNGFPGVDSRSIMVTAGAVNALNVAVMAITDPGEEVLVLTPCWPFFMGIVTMAGCTVRQVPFYQSLMEGESFSVEELLEREVRENTVAIYVNTPNNPTGKVLSKEQMKAIAALAARHHLWVISDEAYESFVYDNRTHTPFAVATGLMDQTLSVYTFSKMFLVAGFRLGYLVARPEWLKMLNKAVVHEIYSAPVPLQYMMIQAVQSRKEWIGEVRQHYQELRDIVHQELRIPHALPEAGYYFFLSLRSYHHGNFQGLFEKILESGVALAPGFDFGKDFADYVRLCFTNTEPERLRKGIDLLNQILGV